MRIILLLMLLQGCAIQPMRACGTFNLEQLEDDLNSGYFDRADIELAKAVLVRLKLQLECERRVNEN